MEQQGLTLSQSSWSRLRLQQAVKHSTTTTTKKEIAMSDKPQIPAGLPAGRKGASGA